MAGFPDLSDALVAQVLAHLPLQDRLRASAVCRQWRRASAAPSTAWAELEWRCTSLEQWHDLMLWLRPRMPGVRRLQLVLTAQLFTGRRQRQNRELTALRVLGTRLATAAVLRQLSLHWSVEAGRDARPGGNALAVAELLPAPSLAPRHARGLPAPALTRLELYCSWGVALCTTLCLLTSLRHLAVGVHRDYRGFWGPLLAHPAMLRAAAPTASLPLCLPPALASLSLSSPIAAASLAACGAPLAAALPALRELRLRWRYDEPEDPQEVASAAGKLLDALLPLAGQLEALELPERCMPPRALARFTALRTLRACYQPAGADRAGHAALKSAWEEVFVHLRFLRCLDIHLEIRDVGFGSITQPLEFPLPLAALPMSLRELQLGTEPMAKMPLPAGLYLRGLERLSVGARTALRLAPLLPFMPQLTHLEVLNCDESEIFNHRPGSSSGDAELDAAAAAAAALDVRPGAGAEGRLALALARCPCLRSLCLIGIEIYWRSVHVSNVAMALRLQRLRSDVAVEVALCNGSVGEDWWY